MGYERTLISRLEERVNSLEQEIEKLKDPKAYKRKIESATKCMNENCNKLTNQKFCSRRCRERVEWLESIKNLPPKPKVPPELLEWFQCTKDSCRKIYDSNEKSCHKIENWDSEYVTYRPMPKLDYPCNKCELIYLDHIKTGASEHKFEINDLESDDTKGRFRYFIRLEETGGYYCWWNNI